MYNIVKFYCTTLYDNDDFINYKHKSFNYLVRSMYNSESTKNFTEKRSSHYEFCILDLPQSVEWGFDGLVLNGKT